MARRQLVLCLSLRLVLAAVAAEPDRFGTPREPIAAAGSQVKDLVAEFSVLPSAFPTEHYRPKDAVFASAAAFETLENELRCAQKVAHPLYRLSKVGANDFDATKLLVVSLAERTNTLVYEMMSDLCTTADPVIKRLLRKLEIVFLPALPDPETFCYDYNSTLAFSLIVSEAVKALPDIEFVLIFSTGGIKVPRCGESPMMSQVRYIDSVDSTREPALHFAEVYKESHPAMKGLSVSELCSGAKTLYSPQLMKKFSWDIQGIVLPTTLLVQTSCCYEGGSGGHLYSENRDAVRSLLIDLTQGLFIKSDLKELSVKIQFPSQETRIIEISETTTKIKLPFGKFHVEIRSGDEIVKDFSLEITPSAPIQTHYITRVNVQPGSAALPYSFVAAVMLLVMVCLCASFVRHLAGGPSRVQLCRLHAHRDGSPPRTASQIKIYGWSDDDDDDDE